MNLIRCQLKKPVFQLNSDKKENFMLASFMQICRGSYIVSIYLHDFFLSTLTFDSNGYLLNFSQGFHNFQVQIMKILLSFNPGISL